MDEQELEQLDDIEILYANIAALNRILITKGITTIEEIQAYFEAFVKENSEGEIDRNSQWLQG